MKNRRDYFVADRINWRASSFDTINSCLLSEIKNLDLKQEITNEFEQNNGGIPVLVNILSQNEWTTIGTHKVLWKFLQSDDTIKLEQILIDEIKRTTPENLRVKKLPSKEITSLEIHMKDESIKIVKCCAKDLFQFTSVFLMLTRMQK